MMNVEAWRSRLVIAGAAALLLGQGAARGQASAITLLPPPALLTILPPLPALSSTQADAVRLVVKLGQRRVYVYRGEQVLAKYRIAIGKRGWETPTGSFQVLSKEKNPVFKSFRTGKLIKPGPDNPWVCAGLASGQTVKRSLVFTAPIRKNCWVKRFPTAAFGCVTGM
jgi:hypothetical protein